MATAVLKYTFAPLAGFWSSLCRFGEVAGYARAASYLASHGYYEESKNCMMQIEKIKSAK